MLKLPKTPTALLSPRGILTHLAGVSSNVRAAIFFAYWLFLAGMGLLSGQGVFDSLFVALLALVVLIGLVVVQRWSEMMLPTSTGGRLALHSVTALTLVVGWFVLFVPILMLMALLLWGLFALPLWLMR
jgi:hypothetical protein